MGRDCKGILWRGATGSKMSLTTPAGWTMADQRVPARARTTPCGSLCRARLGKPGSKAAGVALDRMIASGQVDFGRGQVIDLELRVRGYAVEVLRVCPITPAQRIEDKPADLPFLGRVRVQVPETGVLLRRRLDWGITSRWWPRPGCAWSCASRWRRRCGIMRRRMVWGWPPGRTERESGNAPWCGGPVTAARKGSGGLAQGRKTSSRQAASRIRSTH